jgi:hypothetical protein
MQYLNNLSIINSQMLASGLISYFEPLLNVTTH